MKLDTGRPPGPLRPAQRQIHDLATSGRSTGWRVPARLEARTGAWSVALLLVLALILLTAVQLADDRVRFVALAPGARAGIEAASAVARLFGALVLFLFPTGRAERRLHWVAGGFVILGVGGFVFGYLAPEVGQNLSLNTSLYLWLVVRAIAGILFVIGLITVVAPRFGWSAMLGALAALAFLSAGVLVAQDSLPLFTHSSLARAGANISPTHLTAWHWSSESVLMLLALAALAGAAKLVQEGVVGSWLLIAMVFHAGSQLLGALFPSPYTPLLSSADVLRDLFALTVAIGGIFEVRGVAEERAALLTVEREYSRGLAELDEIKANFVAMAAHELGSPITAIRGLTEMLAVGEIKPEEAHAAITAETNLLSTLVADVQLGTAVEQQDFSVDVRPVPLSALLDDAAVFARILPGDHPVTRTLPSDALVLADPERIRQVLRNLLSNAAKYSPPRSPIQLRGMVDGPRATIEVVDSGYGIHPEDVEHIFDKFERGRDAKDQRVPGAGLGLYLSRQIVRAHGSDLTVEPRREGGSIFRCELEVVDQGQDGVALAAPVRLLIVDDHASFRQSLARLLEREPDISTVTQAGVMSTARKVLEGVDVALIDLHLPDGSGIDLIGELLTASPEAAVLALTASTDPQELAGAVDAGAVGLLHKSASVDEIITAIRRSTAREPLLSSAEVMEMLRLARQQREEVRGMETALSHLTPREREVLRALAEGLSDKEIAKRLSISTGTARTHVVNILAKLGVNSRLQAVVVATRHGVVDISDTRLRRL